MLRIENKEELVDYIKKIQKESYFKGYPTSDHLKAIMVPFGKEGDAHNRYAWNTPSIVLDFQGEQIAVRPTTLGTLFLNKTRQLSERLLDSEPSIVYEKDRDRIQREAKTYRELAAENYNTLDSRQEIIEDTDLENILLTTPTPAGKHVIDQIDKGSEKEKLKYLSDAAKLLNERHYTHDKVWGDPSLVNMAYDENDTLYQYNEGLKPNMNKNKNELMAKNFINLCISGTYRSKLDPEIVAKTMLEAYAPSQEVKEHIKKFTNSENQKKINPLKLPVRYVHNRLVYGMNEKRKKSIQTAIYNALS